MDDWTGMEGQSCPEADECEEMLAKLSDIRFYLSRRAAQERTRTYQRDQKRKQRSPTRLGAHEEAALGGPPEAA
jgi:hypothetical protein